MFCMCIEVFSVLGPFWLLWKSSGSNLWGSMGIGIASQSRLFQGWKILRQPAKAQVRSARVHFEYIQHGIWVNQWMFASRAADDAQKESMGHGESWSITRCIYLDDHQNGYISLSSKRFQSGIKTVRANPACAVRSTILKWREVKSEDGSSCQIVRFDMPLGSLVNWKMSAVFSPHLVCSKTASNPPITRPVVTTFSRADLIMFLGKSYRSISISNWNLFHDTKDLHPTLSRRFWNHRLHKLLFATEVLPFTTDFW